MKNFLLRLLRSLFGDDGSKDAEALRVADAARRRLTLLRLPDGVLRSAAQRVAYASGKYLESAAKGGPRDPRCEGALAEALAAVDDYLRLADASSADRRFGAAMAGREESAGESSGGEPAAVGTDIAVAEKTAVAVLDASARSIEDALALDLGGYAEDARGTGATVADRAEARRELS